ncbi:uncharacterized protein [Paramisgurnus dabryanus]|uniref:uncharacterized protein isoform X2 n=2 Tax=Paramisgurnus dabryanus TaxID=90735 RepID=UPI0031F45195
MIGMFHIVVFDNTNEVEVVPSSWIKNGECMWPPNKIDIAKAVKLQECPGDEWKPHKARIIFTSNDYNEARRKLPQAVDHTDIGSDGGNSPIQFKRKRIPKNNIFPGEDDDEMENTLKEKKSKKGKLPNAPKIMRQHKGPALEPVKQNSPKLHQRDHRASQVHPKGHSAADLHPKANSTFDLHRRGHSSPELFPSDDSTPELYPRGHSSPELFPSDDCTPELYPRGHSSPEPNPRGLNSHKLHSSQHYSSKLSSSKHTITERCTSRHVSPEIRPLRHASSEIHTSSNTSSKISRTNHASREILRSCHASSDIRRPRPCHTAPSPDPLKHTEPHQSREQTSSLQSSLLRNILTKQEMVMDQLRIIFKTLQSMKSTDESQTDLAQNVLPLKDVSSLQDIEEQLRSNPDLQKQLVHALALKGGVDVHECIWRIMHGLVTNDLAKKINMRGINGKIGFQRLRLRDVVIAAVRRNHLTSAATEKEIDSNIKRWLYLAPDRDGGRRERMKRKERQESTTG